MMFSKEYFKYLLTSNRYLLILVFFLFAFSMLKWLCVRYLPVAAAMLMCACITCSCTSSEGPLSESRPVSPMATT